MVGVQVVYSGPLDLAAPYFKEVGFVADQLRSNIADYMLDLVIRATDADVTALVHQFAGYALWWCPVCGPPPHTPPPAPLLLLPQPALDLCLLFRSPDCTLSLNRLAPAFCTLQTALGPLSLLFQSFCSPFLTFAKVLCMPLQRCCIHMHEPCICCVETAAQTATTLHLSACWLHLVLSLQFAIA